MSWLLTGPGCEINHIGPEIPPLMGCKRLIPKGLTVFFCNAIVHTEMRSAERRVNMSRKYQRRNTRVIANNTHHDRPTNPGVVMLTQAADQKVHEKCEEIAKALAEQA